MQRILNSDISQYKIAVDDRINSLEHLDECITERSSFLQDFQEMLKKQMDLIGSDRTSPYEKQQGDLLRMPSRDVLSDLKPDSNKENKFSSNEKLIVDRWPSKLKIVKHLSTMQ